MIFMMPLSLSVRSFRSGIPLILLTFLIVPSGKALSPLLVDVISYEADLSEDEVCLCYKICFFSLAASSEILFILGYR